MDDEPSKKVDPSKSTYDAKLFRFLNSQLDVIKNRPSDRDWILGQLDRVSNLSLYLYLWSESLRQNGGTIEDAQGSIGLVELKILGVKELVDAKDFSVEELNQHKTLLDQEVGQTVGSFYDQLAEEVKTRFSDLSVEDVAPIHHTVITDLRVLRGVKEDVQAGQISNVDQLRNMLYKMACIGEVARRSVDGARAIPTLNAVTGFDEVLHDLSGDISLNDAVKDREYRIRIAAAEKGTSLLPRDVKDLKLIKNSYEDFKASLQKRSS